MAVHWEWDNTTRSEIGVLERSQIPISNSKAAALLAAMPEAILLLLWCSGCLPVPEVRNAIAFIESIWLGNLVLAIGVALDLGMAISKTFRLRVKHVRLLTRKWNFTQYSITRHSSQHRSDRRDGSTGHSAATQAQESGNSLFITLIYITQPVSTHSAVTQSSTTSGVNRRAWACHREAGAGAVGWEWEPGDCGERSSIG